MKTIIVKYILGSGDLGNQKYTFLADGDVKEGDVLETPEYDNKMKITRVIDGHYPYYSPKHNKLYAEKQPDVSTINLKILMVSNSPKGRRVAPNTIPATRLERSEN